MKSLRCQLVMSMKWGITTINTGHVEIETKKKKRFYIIKSGKEYLAGIGLKTFLQALDRGYLDKDLFLLGSTFHNGE